MWFKRALAGFLRTLLNGSHFDAVRVVVLGLIGHFNLLCWAVRLQLKAGGCMSTNTFLYEAIDQECSSDYIS
ncbi:hypothetical protein CRD59_06450 [Bifidobacterium xylocopae]|uniref:Uncharacterized protein n=1 Tax=Bifidobacterium xylocopae TaxID=2493119 RepID=A0A366KE37_9BIFI|nr:hypothetical protein CRD59_06450 [Bifidobacterium xylocopae]